jgi:D-sedoheptulose 7-phosphate isomerase
MKESLRERLLVSVEQGFSESIKLKESVYRLGRESILDMAELLVQAFRGNHRLFLFGNGGSAADAQHLAAEFINRFQRNRPPLPAIALSVDTSVLTSISNDFQFDDVFLRQVQGLAQPGDVALGISTSGRSENVIRALKWSREHGIHTLGLTGAAQTEMDVYCDIILHVPSQATPRIQECHITIGHILCELVEDILFGSVERDSE